MFKSSFSMLKSITLICVGLYGVMPQIVNAQSNPSVDWSGGYSFPTPNETIARTNMIDIIAKVEAGYYDTLGTSYNYTYNYNTYDSSVGTVNVHAAEGATVDASIRTSEGSGTSTYTVGAINTSNNNVQIKGSGNILDISNLASNTGCQDGKITATGTGLGTGGNLADITGGASVSSALGSPSCR